MSIATTIGIVVLAAAGFLLLRACIDIAQRLSDIEYEQKRTREQIDVAMDLLQGLHRRLNDQR